MERENVTSWPPQFELGVDYLTESLIILKRPPLFQVTVISREISRNF